MTLDEQLAYFDRNFDKAYSRCLHDFKADKDDIKALARQRLIDNYPAYGDTGFHRPYAELREEMFQEFADAPVWRLTMMFQGWF